METLISCFAEGLGKEGTKTFSAYEVMFRTKSWSSKSSTLLQVRKVYIYMEMIPRATTVRIV